MWNRRGLLDRALDASIYFSFDRSGFKRHSRRFDPADLDVSVEGRRIWVTGANSGLGRAAALRLAHLGAEVWLLCRSQERGERALEDLKLSSGNNALRLELVDVSDLRSVEEFCARHREVAVDALVHNAGILPSERRETGDGLESTWATNVTGPFLMTWRLAPNLRRAAQARGEARVINVTSGGMYTQKMNLDDVNWTRREFDGVEAYAQTKRAEVILTELWADRFAGSGIQVHSMHPGWADTPAVREALPRFYRFTKDRLRTPREGADTIVYLSVAPGLRATSGRLYFDRRPAPTHAFPWTRESDTVRHGLWRLCCEQAGLPTDRPPLDPEEMNP